jgi:hypothetical protein
VCILDSLKSKFSLTWRVSFPLGGSSANKRHTLSGPVQAQHIDAVFPEVIILGSLIIATKFVEDMHEPTAHFASAWGNDLWTCEQINFTERCIMESLGYRIMPLWNEKYIKQARHDIELARREMLDEDMGDLVTPDDGTVMKHSKSKSEGHAVTGLGYQLTPVDTPRSEAPSPFSGSRQQGSYFP